MGMPVRFRPLPPDATAAACGGPYGATSGLAGVMQVLHSEVGVSSVPPRMLTKGDRQLVTRICRPGPVAGLRRSTTCARRVSRLSRLRTTIDTRDLIREVIFSI